MEKEEVNLTHKQPGKKVIAKDDIHVPVIKDKGRPSDKGYTLKRMHAITNYEIAYEKLFNEDDNDEYITELMEALSSGYEKANIQDRCDKETQTNLKLCEMDDDSIKNVIQDIIFDTSDEYIFKDVYSSDDEEFASVSSEQVQEMLNLEDSKKMMKKTIFGIRTDPVTGKIILVIHDEKGEAELVPIGRGLVSDIKVTVNPKWADYPEVLVTDSENDLIHPLPYEGLPDNYDKNMFDKMKLRTVEATKLFDYNYVDYMDESFTLTEWPPNELKPSANILTKNKINKLPQIKEKGFQEKRKKRTYDKRKVIQQKEMSKTEQTENALQTENSVKWYTGATTPEYSSFSESSSHPNQIKHDSSSGESSSIKQALRDNDGLTMLKVKKTDSKEKDRLVIKDKMHPKKHNGKKQHEPDQNLAKMKEVSSRGLGKNEYKADQKSAIIRESLHSLDEKGLNESVPNLVKMKQVPEENGSEVDQNWLVKEDPSKPYETKETEQTEPNLFLKEVDSHLLDEKRNFKTESNLLLSEEIDSKLHETSGTHRTDPNVFIKEVELEIQGEKRGFKLGSNLREAADSEINKSKEILQSDSYLFIKEDESTIHSNERERHEPAQNLFIKKTKDHRIFEEVGNYSSDAEESDFDDRKSKTKKQVTKEVEFDPFYHIEDFKHPTKLHERSKEMTTTPKARSAEVIAKTYQLSEQQRKSRKPTAETLTESESVRTDLDGGEDKKESAFLLDMPAASTQTSTSASSPGKRSSILEALQKVEEEMRPLKHQLAEIQRQMWEIDASYPEAISTDTRAGTSSEPTSSFYSPHNNYAFASQPFCKCPSRECHVSSQTICRKVLQERQMRPPVPLTRLPTASELARRLIPPPRSATSASQSIWTEPEDVFSEQNKQPSKKFNGKQKGI